MQNSKRAPQNGLPASTVVSDNVHVPNLGPHQRRKGSLMNDRLWFCQSSRLAFAAAHQPVPQIWTKAFSKPRAQFFAGYLQVWSGLPDPLFLMMSHHLRHATAPPPPLGEGLFFGSHVSRPTVDRRHRLCVARPECPACTAKNEPNV